MGVFNAQAFSTPLASTLLAAGALALLGMVLLVLAHATRRRLVRALVRVAASPDATEPGRQIDDRSAFPAAAEEILARSLVTGRASAPTRAPPEPPPSLRSSDDIEQLLPDVGGDAPGAARPSRSHAAEAISS
jgi:hypothetical protein